MQTVSFVILNEYRNRNSPPEKIPFVLPQTEQTASEEETKEQTKKLSGTMILGRNSMQSVLRFSHSANATFQRSRYRINDFSANFRSKTNQLPSFCVARIFPPIAFNTFEIFAV